MIVLYLAIINKERARWALGRKINDIRHRSIISYDLPWGRPNAGVHCDLSPGNLLPTCTCLFEVQVGGITCPCLFEVLQAKVYPALASLRFSRQRYRWSPKKIIGFHPIPSAAERPATKRSASISSIFIGYHWSSLPFFVLWPYGQKLPRRHANKYYFALIFAL